MKMKMTMNFHCFDILYIVRVTSLEPTVLASNYFGCFGLWLCCAASLTIGAACRLQYDQCSVIVVQDLITAATYAAAAAVATGSYV
jgi:hypothetical protein